MEQIGKILQFAKSHSSEAHTANAVDFEAKRKQQAELFQAACKTVCPAFVVDHRNKSLMNELFLYMNGCSSRLDSSKGLWLYGTIGTGKSTILKILRAYDFQRNYAAENMRSTGGFGIVSASMVANQYAIKGLEGINLYGYNTPSSPIVWAFDEVGREPCPAKYYGTESNVMQFLFQTRYDLRHTALTHVSTNLDINEITRQYGDYIADRVNEMFNVIELAGASRR